MLLSPPSTATSIIARIRYTDQTVLCWFPERDDAFRKKVKALGLRWCFDTRAWRREQGWEVTYYKKHPTWILRGGWEMTGMDYTGIDEAECIRLIAGLETYQVVGDLCMGRGLVGLAAYRAGKPFVGTELNKRRLACLLAGLKKLGADVRRYGEENGRNSDESE